MDQVRFDIEPPVHGWALVRVTAPGVSLEIDASYTPRDSITDVAFAISAMLVGHPIPVVVWNTEPQEFDFDFQTSGDSVRLEIHKFPNHSRSRNHRGTPVAVIESGLTKLAEAIWRGLRRLEGKISHGEYALAWQHDFPAGIMQRIGIELRAKRENVRDAVQEAGAEPRLEVGD